jgi:hypothetical protein
MRLSLALAAIERFVHDRQVPRHIHAVAIGSRCHSALHWPGKEPCLTEPHLPYHVADKSQPDPRQLPATNRHGCGLGQAIIDAIRQPI